MSKLKIKGPIMALDEERFLEELNNIEKNDHQALPEGLSIEEELSSEQRLRLYRALRKNTTLKQIELRNIGISDIENKDLSQALANSSALTNLDLSGNNLEEEGLINVCAALYRKKNLSSLWLNSNPQAGRGATALKGFLRFNQFLKELYIDDINLRDEGTKLIAEALATNKSLSLMSLAANNIGPDGAAALAQALMTNTMLVSLDLYGNNLGNEGAKVLSSVFQKNKSLTSLNLQGNYIDEAGARDIKNALEANKTLIDLDLEDNFIQPETLESINELCTINFFYASKEIISLIEGGLLPQDPYDLAIYQIIAFTPSHILKIDISPPVQAQAQYLLAECFNKGYLITQDQAKAIILYKKAIAQGYTKAIESLNCLQTWLEKKAAASSSCARIFTPESSSSQVSIPRDFNFLYPNFIISGEEITLGNTIGNGGFGYVKLASWQGVSVAVKCLEFPPDYSQEKRLERFQREAEIMLRLRHPRLVALYGVMLSPYRLIMEYMAGGNLRDKLQSSDNISWALRFAWAQQIAEGLDFLHKKNIVYKDVKSNNILLTKDEEARLSDFGLSGGEAEFHVTEEGRNAPNHLAAPELLLKVRGYYASPQTDMYSYGTILWELATRANPYKEMEDEEGFRVIPKFLPEEYTSTVPADTPLPWIDLIRNCVETLPSKRPTASDAIAQLKNMAVLPVFKDESQNVRFKK